MGRAALRGGDRIGWEDFHHCHGEQHGGGHGCAKMGVLARGSVSLGRWGLLAAPQGCS